MRTSARHIRRIRQIPEAICVTNEPQPIRKILLKPENYGWLAKWPIQLREHDITYKPRSPIKGQIIADFIAETPRNNSSIEHGGAKTSRLRFQEKTPIWTLYIDGASSNEVSGAGVILTDPDGKEIAYALRF
ncbi:hypothetical protein Tco_0555439, partial [Tanacetum coccineum]